MHDIVINVRSQQAPLTGVQRYIHEMCGQLKDRIHRIAPRRPLLGLAGHLWEQSILPGMLKDKLLWSPANTGPLRVTNQVITIHDVAPLDHPEWFSAKFAGWYRWLIPRLVKRAQRIITVSSFSKTRLLELTDIEESQIVVIPNGVNQNFFRRTPTEIDFVKHQLGVDTSRYLLTLGSIEPRKNLVRLLDAWQKCQGSLSSDISLVIAGARGAPHIYRSVTMKDLPAMVRFTESVRDDWLPALYSGATALIYPSLYEGFGLPVVEAMATGTVPIVSNSTALPEVVGDAGLMVNPFDIEELAHAMVKICRDDALRERLSQAAIRESGRFRWERASQLVLNVLEQAAA
jgi:glycosyltransferase involved in cell wall biosynthesis